MAGWDLKKGLIKRSSIKNNEILNEIEKFLSKKTVMKNLYKIFLLRSLITVSLNIEDSDLNVFKEINYQFAKENWDFFNQVKDNISVAIYNGKNIKSAQQLNIEYIKEKYFLLDEEFQFLNLKIKEEYLELTSKVLKTNVIGALYFNFDESIYEFDLKKEELRINKDYYLFFREKNELLKIILKYKTIEFLKITEKNKKVLEKIVSILYKENVDENFEEKINIIYKKMLLNKGGKMHSKQGFGFQVGYSITLLEMIEEGVTTKGELVDLKGIGRNKIDTHIEWLRFIGAIRVLNQKIYLTEFGKFYLKIKYSNDFLEPLMLYRLVKNPNLEKEHGHFYFSTLINEILYEALIENKINISLEEIKNKFLTVDEEKNLKFVTSTIGALVNSETGFGKIGILEKIGNSEKKTKDDKFEIHSYWVEPLVAAYIIYDLWEENQVAKSIKEIETEKYNIGRIFLMDNEAVMETLSEIEALRLITIETIAGLNQIRINPRITKEDILDMIIAEA